MNSEKFQVTLTDEEYGFDQEDLTFTYTEKDLGDQKVERYQLRDDLGIVFSGEKIWKTQEQKGFLGLWTNQREVYEQQVQKRIGYDTKMQSVVTEDSSWSEFRDILQGTEAEKYII
jgi:hypothetical protein